MLNLPFLEKEIVPFGAPLSLIKFVKLLVSRPVIPTILFLTSNLSVLKLYSLMGLKFQN